MDKNELKNIVARLRKKFNREDGVGFLTLQEFAGLCTSKGLDMFTTRYWRDRCRDREWPSVLLLGKYHVRKDYAEEFCRILTAEAA